MRQNKAEKGHYNCTFCGNKNPYPSNLSNYLIEGDYSVTQRADREPRPKKYGLYCSHCGRLNEIEIARI